LPIGARNLKIRTHQVRFAKALARAHSVSWILSSVFFISPVTTFRKILFLSQSTTYPEFFENLARRHFTLNSESK